MVPQLETPDARLGKQSPTLWVPSVRFHPGVQRRLFCMPYAGGAASIYRSWPNAFPSDIDVCAVEFPGRGTRLKEKPYTSISLLVDALCRALLPFLDRPFALFGHSMGALLAFETARHLGRLYQITPSHLFISGHSAPQFPMSYPVHDMAEKELIELLQKLSGTPPEILENRELMDLMLPILRADFAICELYKYMEDRALECPISVFGGLKDEETPRGHLDGWREHTTGAFTLRMFPGGHFFIHSSQKQIMECVMREIFAFDGMRRRGPAP